MTWREMFELERFRARDASPVVAEVGNLDQAPRAPYWGDGAREFTVWSVERVYFGNSYDGMASVSSVARSPCDTAFGFENGEPVGEEAMLGVVFGRDLEWGGDEACGDTPHFGDPCRSCGATRGP